MYGLILLSLYLAAMVPGSLTQSREDNVRYTIDQGARTEPQAPAREPSGPQDEAMRLVCDNPCSKGTRAGLYCLEVIGQTKSWPLARDACSNAGGRLAVLEDRAEAFLALAYITKLFGTTYAQVWVGATKIRGSWTWVNNVPVSSIYPWGPTQPSGDGDCMSIITSINDNPSDFGINDANCEKHQFQYMCQYDYQ